MKTPNVSFPLMTSLCYENKKYCMLDNQRIPSGPTDMRPENLDSFIGLDTRMFCIYHDSWGYRVTLPAHIMTETV